MAGKHSRVSPVPVYQLYGESDPETLVDLVHGELIAARSRLHNWEIQPHRHHGLFQILWLARGSARVALDGRHDTLPAGRVLMLPPQCIHGFRFSPGADGVVVTFSCTLFERLQSGLADLLRGMTVPAVCVLTESPDRKRIEMSFDAIHEACTGQDVHRGLLLEAQLVSILVWLSRMLPGAAAEMPLARGREHLARFSQLIEEKFTQHLPLEDYAANLNISTAHLNALCRRLTNHSALSLVHARIINEARRHLTYTLMPVRDIAELLGFSDPAYFTRFFKRATGVSPAVFRSRVLSAGESS